MTQQLTEADVENAVNDYAKGVAKKMGIREGIWRIHLVKTLKHNSDSEVIPGPTVQILLNWPKIMPRINMILKSAFTLIRSRANIHTPCYVASVAYFAKEGAAVNKWKREKLGKDIAEAIEELIERQRVKVTTKTITTYEDTLTGISLDVVSEPTVDHYRSTNLDYWLALSRLVNTHAEEQSATTGGEPQDAPEPGSAVDSEGGEGSAAACGRPQDDDREEVCGDRGSSPRVIDLLVREETSWVIAQ